MPTVPVPVTNHKQSAHHTSRIPFQHAAKALCPFFKSGDINHAVIFRKCMLHEGCDEVSAGTYALAATATRHNYVCHYCSQHKSKS
mmetsp:Transcript_8249/g.12275  ORF Transcript_8249/g.12275 Transcript_8249/m.12275 type:complete len:86 (+) Transcript_8249:53-310(+)